MYKQYQTLHCAEIPTRRHQSLKKPINDILRLLVLTTTPKTVSDTLHVAIGNPKTNELIPQPRPTTPKILTRKFQPSSDHVHSVHTFPQTDSPSPRTLDHFAPEAPKSTDSPVLQKPNYQRVLATKAPTTENRLSGLLAQEPGNGNQSFESHSGKSSGHWRQTVVEHPN